MPPRLVVAALAAVSALLGCSEPLTVQDLAGTYALTEMNGRRLPQLLTVSPSDCDEWVQNCRLTLPRESVTPSSGNFELVVDGVVDCTRAGLPNSPLLLGVDGTYTVSGTTLHFSAPSYLSPIEFTGHVNPFQMSVHVSDLVFFHRSRLTSTFVVKPGSRPSRGLTC